jgi:hypothetical protein
LTESEEMNENVQSGRRNVVAKHEIFDLRTQKVHDENCQKSSEKRENDENPSCEVERQQKLLKTGIFFTRRPRDSTVISKKGMTRDRFNICK